MRPLLHLLAAPALLLAHNAGAQAFAPSSDAIILRPGDAVRITVWQRPELGGELVIGGNGSPTHPLYRSVQVTGVPFGAVEERVRVFLARFIDEPQFVVEPLLRVTVGGEVGRPNLYMLRPETSIAQAVALAGGPSERGRDDRVRLVRGGRVFTLDLRRPEPGAAQEPIRSGDEIIVERRRSIFRDQIAPVVAMVGAAAAVYNVFTRTGR